MESERRALAATCALAGTAALGFVVVITSTLIPRSAIAALGDDSAPESTATVTVTAVVTQPASTDATPTIPSILGTAPRRVAGPTTILTTRSGGAQVAVDGRDVQVSAAHAIAGHDLAGSAPSRPAGAAPTSTHHQPASSGPTHSGPSHSGSTHPGSTGSGPGQPAPTPGTSTPPAVQPPAATVPDPTPAKPDPAPATPTPTDTSPSSTDLAASWGSGMGWLAGQVAAWWQGSGWWAHHPHG